MSIVTASHLALVRARRQLEKAYIDNDWNAVRQWDRQIGEQLNSAFGDEHRDTRALVSELERVLGLYARMVKTLPVEVAARLSPL